MHHFQTIDELLAFADKFVSEMTTMFPNASKEGLKANILIYLLKNSTLKNEDCQKVVNQDTKPN